MGTEKRRTPNEDSEYVNRKQSTYVKLEKRGWVKDK